MSNTPRLAQVGRWFRRAGLVLIAIAAGSVVARQIFFAGPYLPPTPLPSAAFIDAHCHTAGLGAGGSGCFISDEFLHSWKLGVYFKSFGVTRKDVERDGDALIVRRLSKSIAEAPFLRGAVILALDGVVDSRGELDKARTQVYIPNEFVAKETARTTNLYFGASINPYRKDALDRLDWAASHGAVLVKWVPPVMDIDPADPRVERFYRKMAELKIPLLCHTGPEKSFLHADERLADPNRLRLPLQLGVTVIAAHAGGTGKVDGERSVDILARMMGEFTNLYVDISALTLVNKPGCLKSVLENPVLRDHAIYGSDAPLINTPLVSPFRLTIRQMIRLHRLSNPWERDIEIKQALGVPTEVFERGNSVLRLPVKVAPKL